MVHPSHYPSLALFLDGAHTDQSIRLAVQWYDQEHNRRDSTAIRGLIFHCNTEKVVVDLLKHLVWDRKANSPRFSWVCFCPVSLSRPTLAEEVGADAIISRQTQEEASEERPPTDHLLSLLPTARRTLPPQGHTLPWQSSLSEVWRAMEIYESTNRGGSSGGMSPQDVDIASSSITTQVTVQPSMKAALDYLNEAARGGDKLMHVLVTGSLYLVGDALAGLEALDEPPK